MSDDNIGPFFVKGEDGVVRGLNEHYDSQQDVGQDPYGAWLAIQNLWTDRQEMALQILSDLSQAQEAYDAQKAAEAKLEKAVYAMEVWLQAQEPDIDIAIKLMHDTLAELKGQDDGDS